jgi:cation transport regulator ChaB
MPYGNTKELGKGKEGLPEGAKKIFVAAFNAAYKQSQSESRASAIAWSAVKKKYKKEGEKWVAKDSAEINDAEFDFEQAMELEDAATLQLTKDGYLIATPRIARTGIQIYRGWEVGDERDEIRVYRPDTEVFHIDSMKALAHKPVTLHHPPTMVDSSNWREYTVGRSVVRSRVMATLFVYP